MALLVALLLAVSSLSGHAAMDHDTRHSDCIAPQMQSLEGAHDMATDAGGEAFGCSACSALTPMVYLAMAEPASPAIAPAVAVDDRTPRPPRRPPKA